MACHDTVASAMAAQMSNDEKLLASCLIKSLAPFDMSLAWALCAKVFNDDKVVWRSFLSLIYPLI